jgi:hypothetical protein
MKKINPNEIHTFQIDLKQYVNEIKWDSHFKEYMHGNQTKIKYGCIEFTGTTSELNAFLDKMPDNDTQFKLIGVTNLSDVLIDVNLIDDLIDTNCENQLKKAVGSTFVKCRFVEIRCENQVKRVLLEDLSKIFLDSADLARMEANFIRGMNFRTWIRRSDFESLPIPNFIL